MEAGALWSMMSMDLFKVMTSCTVMVGTTRHASSVTDKAQVCSVSSVSDSHGFPSPVHVVPSSISVYPVGQVHSKEPSLLRHPPVHC